MASTGFLATMQVTDGKGMSMNAKAINDTARRIEEANGEIFAAKIRAAEHASLAPPVAVRASAASAAAPSTPPPSDIALRAAQKAHARECQRGDNLT